MVKLFVLELMLWGMIKKPVSYWFKSINPLLALPLTPNQEKAFQLIKDGANAHVVEVKGKEYLEVASKFHLELKYQ